MDIKREVHDIRAAMDVIVSKFEAILVKNNVFVASAAPLAQGSPLAGWQAGRQKDNVHVARLTTESMALKQHNETLSIENAKLRAGTDRLDRKEKTIGAALQNTQAHNEQLTSNLAKISADNQTTQAHNEQLTAKLAKISADLAGCEPALLAQLIQNIDGKPKSEAASRSESTSATIALLSSTAIAQDTIFAGQGSSMRGGPGGLGSYSVPMLGSAMPNAGFSGMQSPRALSGMASPRPTSPQSMPPGVSVELQKAALVAAGPPVTLKAALDAGMVPVSAGIGPTPSWVAAGMVAASSGMQSPRGASNGASGIPQMGKPQMGVPLVLPLSPAVDVLGTPTLMEFPTGNPFLAGFIGQPSPRPGTPGRLASSLQVAMPPQSPRPGTPGRLASSLQVAMPLQLPRGNSVSVPSPMQSQTNAPAPMRCLSPARLQSPPPLGGTPSMPQRSVTPSWAFSGQPGSPAMRGKSFTDVLFDATDRNQDGLISQFEFRNALTNDIIRPAGQTTAPLGLPDDVAGTIIDFHRVHDQDFYMPGHSQSTFPP